MSDSGSITAWLKRLQAGHDDAMPQLWERFAGRVRLLARRRLPDNLRRVADEEDVVVDVFASLCRGAAAGRFNQVSDRHDLWLLLIGLTKQKSADQQRWLLREKRGGGMTRGDSVFTDRQASNPGFASLESREPDPAELAEIQERFERLLSELRHDTVRAVARLRIEAYSNEEIAAQLGLPLRSVERKVQLIRQKWIEIIEPQ